MLIFNTGLNRRHHISCIRLFAAECWISASHVNVGYGHSFGTLVDWLREAHKQRCPGERVCPRHQEIDAELLFAATNYCFWKGASDVHPAGGGSSLLRSLLLQLRHESETLMEAVSKASVMVSEWGFPLPDIRSEHLMEIARAERVLDEIRHVVMEGKDAVRLVALLRDNFPGFATDPLGKRALLLPHIFHRCYGLFAETIRELPVAVDYQLPKMLRYFGVLQYSDTLTEMVDQGKLIPRHSDLEHELRSATLIVCEQLARNAGITESDVDDLLWGARKSVTTPYHLTVTTDY